MHQVVQDILLQCTKHVVEAAVANSQTRKREGPVDGLTRMVSAARQVLESRDSGIGHGVQRFRDQTRDQHAAKLI